MRRILFIMALICFCMSVQGQIKVSGVITGSGIKDSMTKLDKRLSYVSVNNFRTGSTLFSDKLGNYSINARAGDTLEFKYIGYFTYRYIVPQDATANHTADIDLRYKSKVLQEINFSGLTQYQKDSLERAQLYRKPMSYEQETSMLSPVTAIYQQFSKKYKNLRAFQQQYQSYEEQKFIDTKYTYELVNEITKLEGDSAAYFMNAYPMEYKFARLASPLEIKMWVTDNWKSYNQNKEGIYKRLDSLSNLKR